MTKMSVPIASALAAALVTAVLMSTVFNAQNRTGASSYAEDRAAIEDLQARYLFALDFI